MYRFDKYCGNGVVDKFVEAFNVVKLAKFKAFKHRPEAALDFLLGRGSHAAESPTVEGIFRCDYGVPLRFFAAAQVAAMQSCELNKCVVRFGATIAEQHPAGTCFFHEPICELLLARNAVQIAAVAEGSCLVLHGLDPFRV